ncbi:MAG: hypothetical protein IM628_10650 [Phenylobacterium sp.]|uniref:hypothetical protein n=1 Tax=Phenylobacterium sp. TaxID=1871053 RepID=UPI0025F932C9|nr:hypothetical protein [Phenylobacterium sp.]MCA6305260.1 hypothetical protein [Phenylobacterium sp.]
MDRPDWTDLDALRRVVETSGKESIEAIRAVVEVLQALTAAQADLRSRVEAIERALAPRPAGPPAG